LQLFKPDRFPYPHGHQINAIHICIINPTIRRLKVTGSRYARGRTRGVSNPALQAQRKLAALRSRREITPLVLRFRRDTPTLISVLRPAGIEQETCPQAIGFVPARSQALSQPCARTMMA
jgi:hypothetical protein